MHDQENDSAKVPLCAIPGIAYDSRNRAVILIKSDHNASDALSGQVHILDLATNTWKAGAQLPAKSCLNMGAATYDVNHNLPPLRHRRQAEVLPLQGRLPGGCVSCEGIEVTSWLQRLT